VALAKAITNNKGVTANYHRIVSVTQIYEGPNAGIHINLGGYVNKTIRDRELVEQIERPEESLIVSNTPVYLPFVEGENFRLNAIYLRLKTEILELKASTDI
jgi:hypothetical protein